MATLQEPQVTSEKRAFSNTTPVQPLWTAAGLTLPPRQIYAITLTSYKAHNHDNTSTTLRVRLNGV